jgi:hypothetical protein
MIYLVNAIPGAALIGRTFYGHPVKIQDVRADYPRIHSAVGHQSTAEALSEYLGYPIPMNRETLSFSPGDVIYVAALRGPRLAEGQILSSEEVKSRGFDFLKIRILD